MLNLVERYKISKGDERIGLKAIFKLLDEKILAKPNIHLSRQTQKIDDVIQNFDPKDWETYIKSSKVVEIPIETVKGLGKWNKTQQGLKLLEAGQEGKEVTKYLKVDNGNKEKIGTLQRRGKKVKSQRKGEKDKECISDDALKIMQKTFTKSLTKHGHRIPKAQRVYLVKDLNRALGEGLSHKEIMDLSKIWGKSSKGSIFEHWSKTQLSKKKNSKFFSTKELENTFKGVTKGETIEYTTKAGITKTVKPDLYYNGKNGLTCMDTKNVTKSFESKGAEYGQAVRYAEMIADPTSGYGSGGYLFSSMKAAEDNKAVISDAFEKVLGKDFDKQLSIYYINTKGILQELPIK